MARTKLTRPAGVFKCWEVDRPNDKVVVVAGPHLEHGQQYDEKTFMKANSFALLAQYFISQDRIWVYEMVCRIKAAIELRY